MEKRFLCKIGWHKYKEIKTEQIKNMLFRFAGCEVPAQRVIEECIYCKNIRYIKLNITMPDKYLKMHHLWS